MTGGQQDGFDPNTMEISSSGRTNWKATGTPVEANTFRDLSRSWGL
jgi:hypothetical protein